MNLLRSWLAFLPVSLGLFMVLLDVSILNVALPRIAEDFHARMSDLQWVVNAYTLTMVVLLVLAGRIGDMVRRDHYFILGMVLFTLSSFLCAQSWSIEALIAFRALQAIGGSILSSNTLAIAIELFPPGKRGAIMGLNAIFMASSFTLGPIIGGWLTTHLSWHWVFYINIPIGILAIVLGLILLPPLEAKEKVPVDLLGTFLLAMGLGFLTLGIIKGQDWGWLDQKTLSCFVISIPYLIAFSLRELNYEYPILDLSLFKIRNFTVCVLATTITFFGVSATLFLMPYFLQGIKGLTAEEAGYWMIAIPLSNMVVSPIAGRLSDKTNPKYLMAVAPLFFAFGIYILTSIDINVRYWELFVMLIPIGIGMGMLMSPAFNVIMSSVPPQKAGMANGTIRSINTIGQVMGVAVGGVLLTSRMNEWIPGYGNIVPDPGTMSFLRLIAKFNPVPLIGMTEGFMDSMHYTFSVFMWFPLLSSLIILLFLKGEEHLRKMESAEFG
uniref:DHA2 family efflux MFS transporter permease subunit n=1 Tax=Geoglobus ahangari TaxID=113653 RepID=A0A7J3TIS9_9EURY